jgi:hypothetical protein
MAGTGSPRQPDTAPRTPVVVASSRKPGRSERSLLHPQLVLNAVGRTGNVEGLGLACIGAGLFNPSATAVALSSVPPQKSRLASGTNTTFRHGGVAVGGALFGAVVPAAAALGHGSAAGYVTGMHTAAIIGATLAALGAIVAARLFRVGIASPSKRLTQAAVAGASS